MKNEISSTLFRFVSLRSPDLVQPNTRNDSFVSLPANLHTGVFFDAVNNRPVGTSKAQALITAAKNFTAFKSEAEVRSLGPALHDFATWIARNRTSYTEQQLQAEALGKTYLSDIANGPLSRVWNNLYYQIITNESFYVKEALMQMLIADHLLRLLKQGSGAEEYNKKLMLARVIIPKTLFGDYTLVQNASIPDPAKLLPILPDNKMSQELTVTKAETAISMYRALKSELERLENRYSKETYADYNKEYADFERTNAANFRKYGDEMEDARKAFCALPRPERPYDPKDPCEQPDLVHTPEIPAFDYTFPKEIDATTLQTDLSTQSYIALLDVLGYKFVTPSIPQPQPAPDELINQHDTYESLINVINTEISLNETEIISNTVLTTPQVSIGGIVTPVFESTPMQIDNFVLCGTRSGLTVVFTLRVALSELVQVLDIVVTQNNKDQTIQTYTLFSPNAVRTGNVVQLTSFLSYTFPTFPAANGPTFDFSLQLTNGSSKTISGIDSMTLLNRCTSGTLQQSGPPPVAIPEPIFIPSGFGLKQVGVADYLKVEQSVHCYVEGEVSHIENVMAREYKEKSTRRLVRREETTTTSSETEREQLTDTTTANRFEMQNETDK
ncbi:MAG TPA: hypothetical protein VF602_07575 [Pedobacter sp.]|jgi:hypothetical protein